ncbi:hypothetical protein M436DRAFT_86204 [Aureobasidium namibiae CBS 147.97]|uniref:Uncharacterized protein n=1 Tax=Aureobasidium namibiae CBS 147.97 TaxID=1043004 RepID=A0A074WAQ3_9PEZI
MAEETFYRDQILCTFATSNGSLNANIIIAVAKEHTESGIVANQSTTANAAVLFPDTFRIVLRAAKAEGRQTYEAVLVDGSSHDILLAGGPGLHSIQEALANLLIATSNQINDYLGKKTLEKNTGKHHASGQHGSSTGTSGTAGHA